MISRPTKPSKLRRALTLRPVEWVPLLVAVASNLVGAFWLAASLQHAISPSGTRLPDPHMVAASLFPSWGVWSVARPICIVLVLFGFAGWLVRVNEILHERSIHPEA